MRASFLLFPVVLALASCQTTPPAGPDRFAAADHNGDGRLSRDEVNDYFVAGIFTERDRDGDGYITQAEWNPEMKAAEVKEFKARDLNGDGRVSLAEAQAYARKKGVYDEAFAEADTNRDGFVSREEAVAYYASKEGPVR